MLVLTRKTGESIQIDVDIVVTVVEVRGDKVRLGVDAPAEVDIYRSELLDGTGPTPGRSGEDRA